MPLPSLLIMLAAAAIHTQGGAHHDPQPDMKQKPRSLEIVELNGNFAIKQAGRRAELPVKRAIEVGRGLRLDREILTRDLEVSHASSR